MEVSEALISVLWGFEASSGEIEIDISQLLLTIKNMEVSRSDIFKGLILLTFCASGHIIPDHFWMEMVLALGVEGVIELRASFTERRKYF